MKLCKDCKHVAFHLSTIDGKSVPTMWWCTSMDECNVNPVNGERAETLCEVRRSMRGLLGCGPEAKYWEPKNCVADE